jgi:hypothetical protein
VRALLRRRWVPWAIAGVAALLLVCAAGAIYGLGQLGQADLLGTTLVDQLTREQAEAAAGVRLPASARGLHTHYAAFQDYIIHVRFEIDPADAAGLLGGLPIANPTISSSERPLMYSDGMPEWWRPDGAARFQSVSGEASLPSGAPDSLSVLIDTTDPAVYTVYIVAFDT